MVYRFLLHGVISLPDATSYDKHIYQMCACLSLSLDLARDKRGYMSLFNLHILFCKILNVKGKPKALKRDSIYNIDMLF